MFRTLLSMCAEGCCERVVLHPMDAGMDDLRSDRYVMGDALITLFFVEFVVTPTDAAEVVKRCRISTVFLIDENLIRSGLSPHLLPGLDCSPALCC